jgi:aryl-alcohol dehydrogenase-like predicted oxidoreductase
MAMEYRTLGKSGLKVSVLSFGTMTFGGTGMFGGVGNTQVSDARKQIDLCIEAGVNLFDTADMYSNGDSEVILGEALGSKRADVLIATKAFGPMHTGANDLGLSRFHLIRACEASLRRMKTDYIDLYQVHNVDSLTPTEETLRALDQLVRDGKVRYIGNSNYGGWHLMKAAAVAEKFALEPFVSQQIQYSLLQREAENEMLPCGIDQGIGAVIWGPLAQGYLTGKFKAGMPTEATRLGNNKLIHQFDDERGRATLAAVEDIATARGVSASQVAMNWVRRKPGVATILVGARNETQLLDNLAAARWSLNDDEMARLDEASAKPLQYPYSHHRLFGRGRNPVPGPLPAFVEPKK